MKHVIERTSPKGLKFVGTCRLCGATGLTLADSDDDCANVRGLTEDQALIEAIAPPDDATPTQEGA